MKTSFFCIFAVLALLLGACHAPQAGTDVPPAEVHVAEESGSIVLQDGAGNLLSFSGFSRYPNGNFGFRLTGGKWVICDPEGKVLYNDIDASYTNYHTESYLEDGTTLYRYFDPCGNLTLEGIGEDYADWNLTGLANCFFRYEGDDSTLVRNFAAGKEVSLPCKADFVSFTTEMAEITGRILFADYEKRRSYFVDEALTVSELEGFFCFSRDEAGEACLIRCDRILCDLYGTPLAVTQEETLCAEPG